MSHQPNWRFHAASGRRYHMFRRGGQLGYAFEDGRILTQSEFDQSNERHEQQITPRSMEPSGAQDSRSTRPSRTNSGQADSGQLPRNIDRSVFPEREVSFPPSPNYVVPTRSTSTQQESRRGSTYSTVQSGATIYTSDRTRNRDSDQPSIPGGQLPNNDYPAANTRPLPRLSPLSAAFVGIRMGSYAALHSFVVANPDIVSYTEIDSLIAEARAQKRIGNLIYPQIFVHHALLLRRCKELHPKEYAKFFKQLDDPGNSIRRNFVNSVKTVYETIQDQARATAQQSHVRSLENQGRDMPLVVQPETQVDRHNTTQPLPNRERPNSTEPEAKSRHERDFEYRPSLDTSAKRYRIQDKDGKWVYQDAKRHLLRSKNDYDRHPRNADRHQEESDRRGGGVDRHREENERYREVTVHNQGDIGRHREDIGPYREDINRHREDSNVARMNTEMAELSIRTAGPISTLPEGKVRRGREIKGTEGVVEKLDPRYSKRKDAKKFFSRGRVFSLMLHESAGLSNTSLSEPIGITRGRFGEQVFSHILRMVVVKEQHGACLCVPVHTYGGKGVSKPGFSRADREAHSIIYMSDTKPSRLPTETDMNKKPIAVDKASPDQKLDERSRINFSRVHTVMWNVKVMNVGMVTRESMPSLLSYWKQEVHIDRATNLDSHPGWGDTPNFRESP